MVDIDLRDCIVNYYHDHILRLVALHDSYVTTTKKGDDESEGLLDDLGEYFDNDSGDRFVSKGGGYDPSC